MTASVTLKMLETPEEMTLVEALQRAVWPGSETDVVPAHMLLTAAHNGGLVIGAFEAETNRPIGFVYGFPGYYPTPDGPRLKHCSHMLGVLPDYQNSGVGFLLKRAQWQMVRRMGIDRITWTYDPLLSRNAHLNITRLGAVCNTYLENFYGEMRDGLNVGLPSDRFQVDWWVNSRRVAQRLSRTPRRPLELADFAAAETVIIHPLQGSLEKLSGEERMLLVEIPPQFQELRSSAPALAVEWRQRSREIFLFLFGNGYLVTDAIYEPGETPRSLYVLSQGKSTF